MDKTVRNRTSLTNNLPQLQNVIKRDGAGYKEEFIQQLQHYHALLRLFMVNPMQESVELQELVIFISQVCL